MDASRVLVFVITRQTRSLSSMALAAHYIGLGCNVVLCIQHLADNAEINGDQVRFFTLPYKVLFLNKFLFFFFVADASCHKGLQPWAQLSLWSGEPWRCTRLWRSQRSNRVRYSTLPTTTAAATDNAVATAISVVIECCARTSQLLLSWQNFWNT